MGVCNTLYTIMCEVIREDSEIVNELIGSDRVIAASRRQFYLVAEITEFKGYKAQIERIDECF